MQDNDRDTVREEGDITLPIRIMRDGASVPFYAHDGDAGMDITAAEDCLLRPGEITAVPTGLILGIPRGFEVQIRPRSGLSLRTRLRLPNSPGTIDAGYRDELKILVENSSYPVGITGAEETTESTETAEGTETAKGTEADPYLLTTRQAPHGCYLIRRGDRIAQMVLARVTSADVRVVTSLEDGEVEDRGGGFGSSGLTADEA